MTYETASKDMGRHPLKILTIEQNYCTRSFGVLPCTASGSAGSECFNTYNTCQDLPNFGETLLTTSPKDITSSDWTPSLGGGFDTVDTTANVERHPLTHTMTADFLWETGLSDIYEHSISQDTLTSISSGIIHTANAILKAKERTWAQIYVEDSGTPANNMSAYINLTTGAEGTTAINGAWTGLSVTINDLKDGWWDISVQGAVAATTDSTLYIRLATADGTNSYVFTTQYGIYVAEAKLYEGAYTGNPITKIHTFCDGGHRPHDRGFIPSIENVKINPTKLVPGEGLGPRGSVTITLSDHPDSDVYTDPYVSTRTYDPVSQGTFWSKYVSRDPYSVNDTIRLITGFSGFTNIEFDWEDFEYRTYIISRIDGPDNKGKIRVVAKDVLASDSIKSATCPAPTTVKLVGDVVPFANPDTVTLSGSIGSGDTTLTLTGTSDWDTGYPLQGGFLKLDSEYIYYDNRVAGVFNILTRGVGGTTAASHTSGATEGKISGLALNDSISEFPATLGYVRINDEIVKYEAADYTNNMLVALFRSQEGTEPATHDVNDRIQLCKKWSTVNVVDILEELFSIDTVNGEEYLNLDSSLLNLAEWTIQQRDYLINFNLSRIISEPTKILDLIKELTSQCLVDIWFDDRTGMVELKAIAPPVGTVPTITDEVIIKNSIEKKVEVAHRYSQYWIYFGVKNASEDGTSNFKNLQIQIDQDAETDSQYGKKVIKTIESLWHEADGTVLQAGGRLLAMNRNPKATFKFKLDASDATLETGDDFILSSDFIVDFTGATQDLKCQIISRSELEDVVFYSAREGVFQENYGHIMPNSANDYGSATDDEKATGGYILADNDPDAYLLI